MIFHAQSLMMTTRIRISVPNPNIVDACKIDRDNGSLGR